MSDDVFETNDPAGTDDPAGTAARATILHADLDAFYASVEQRDDPRLRGRPVIVGGGVVLAASYEARAFGVRTAMGGGQARRLCPQAVVVPPRMAAYTEVSRAVFALFRDTTPLVEGLSIDEAFLDVGGLREIAGTPEEIAVGLRRRVRTEAGLPITVGVARTKFLAKVASGVGKPDGLLVVRPDREREFLHPLPVARLWGVGPITAARLGGMGVRTVGDVAALPESVLVSVLGGSSGRHLHALAQGRDPRPVTPGVRRRSMGAQRALGRRPRTPEELDVIALGLVDRLTGRLRKARRVCRTVTLRLRFGDYTRATRSRSLPQATAETDAILRAVRRLVGEALPLIGERGITLLGVALGGLHADAAVQLALPLEGAVPPGALDPALDAVRARFGRTALSRAVLLGKDDALEMPVLEE
ncbi:DNA polymerase IV [Actinocorallia aurea]